LFQGGCLFQLFSLFWISFREIQKLDGPKSEQLPKANKKMTKSWKQTPP
jgi:hypothetical protein